MAGNILGVTGASYKNLTSRWRVQRISCPWGESILLGGGNGEDSGEGCGVCIGITINSSMHLVQEKQVGTVVRSQTFSWGYSESPKRSLGGDPYDQVCIFLSLYKSLLCYSMEKGLKGKYNSPTEARQWYCCSRSVKWDNLCKSRIRVFSRVMGAWFIL